MKEFAQLVAILATSTKTTDKLNALKEYLATAAEEDKIWVVAIFTGRRPRRPLSTTLLASWCIELAGLEHWLFSESYHTVGDLAETIALLLPAKDSSIYSSHTLSHYINLLRSLYNVEEQTKKEKVLQCWAEMNKSEIFVFNKLITGSFRIGVSQKTMVNALASYYNSPPSEIALRISGKWDPETTTLQQLLNSTTDISKPYPFYLAYAIDEDTLQSITPNLWQAEWKWDGIRGQIIKRNNEIFIWSRGEELITTEFPELKALETKLPDNIVLDGEILCIRCLPEGFIPMPFSVLQTRTGRKNVTKKHLEESPAGFVAYDILEYNGEDIRHMPISERRILLEKIVKEVSLPQLQISPLVEFSSLNELKDKRLHSSKFGSEGLMIKKKSSQYETGRKRGNWWKWKIDPLTIDAVLVYAQKGSGRRSNIYTDYTFAVRDGERLITFAKAYSGLTDAEFSQVDNFVKKNSIEKFGPVRTVKPELVFEIAFEGIAESKRHKSGVALRFPRMSRWRKDKKPEDINTLDDLKEILKNYNRNFRPANEKL